jgi:hypothetical protein
LKGKAFFLIMANLKEKRNFFLLSRWFIHPETTREISRSTREKLNHVFAELLFERETDDEYETRTTYFLYHQ